MEAGERVIAYTTILGRVRPNYGHVHFAELRNARPVNPLAPGHLSPYEDATAPRTESIEFRRPGTSKELLPELIRGRVEVVVAVYDDPDRPSPNAWATMPSVPAFLTWRVQRLKDGRIAVREHTAFDVRVDVPLRRHFWRFYARGTRQHMATFKGHRYWRQPGRFLFRLGLLDTRIHEDGIYTLVVTARDSRGNSTATRAIFLIDNRLGWPPRTRQG